MVKAILLGTVEGTRRGQVTRQSHFCTARLKESEDGVGRMKDGKTLRAGPVLPSQIHKGQLRQIKMEKFVLRFYGPVNPMGSCRARSVYLATRLLGRLSPLSG